MAIEVRQLLIRSHVEGDAATALRRADTAAPEPDLEELKRAVMAECRTWLAEQLRERHER